MSDASRIDLVRAFVGESPLARHLGIALTAIEQDRAELVLPFAPEVVTIGDTVHGGAIASLLDTAATCAAWADAAPAPGLGGATVSLAIDYVSAARALDVRAEARCLRRGRSLAFCDVTATTDGERLVARAIATYRFSG